MAVASGVATGTGEAPAGTLENQRVALLVDADGLDAEANDLHDARVSYRKVFGLSTRGRRTVRALAYMTEEEEGARAPLQDHLSTSGFELVRHVGRGKKNWNVRLTLDALAMVDKVDALVMASSDPELLPLLEALRARGLRVEVTSFCTLENNPLAAQAGFYLPLGRGALYVP